jgi:hypothetical protein
MYDGVQIDLHKLLLGKGEWADAATRGMHVYMGLVKVAVGPKDDV